MDKTKNDLSYDKANLDYQAMFSTSRIAYAHCLEEIGRHLSDMRQLSPSHSPDLSAGWLATEARQLTTAAETMRTLEGGLTRGTITITNKPMIKEEQDDGKDIKG